MTKTTLERLVAALADPHCYPHGVARVEVIETHISTVLLTGSYAYKLKKPLDLGFLDFSTLAARREACAEEVRLNRRTAPEIYLDVVAITGTAGAPRVGGDGPALEYAVRMRQFPQDALLDRIAAAGGLTDAVVDATAAAVAAFHGAAAVARMGDPFGTPERIGAPAFQNFDQLAALVGDADLADLRAWTEREHARLDPVFSQRKRDGFVRECHGDLHLGNIALLDGRVTLFDCIEFNADLRWTDVMNEIAFLVMDLLDHGYRPAAHRVLDAYLQLTGDYAGLALLPFYLVYRAMVRAKIAAIRAHQPGMDVHGRTRAQSEYRGYLGLGRELAAPRARSLVIMHGLSGSGKTTVAQRLLEATGAVRIRSDVERKRLHGLAPHAASGARLDAGIYGPEATHRTYDRLAELAGAVLDAGFAAIADAAFLKRDERDAFAALARDRGVPFSIASCTAPVALLRERIAARRGDASEATLAVLDRQLATEEPLGEAELAHAVSIMAGEESYVERLAAKMRSPVATA